jgi:hypothetical protein
VWAGESAQHLQLRFGGFLDGCQATGRGLRIGSDLIHHLLDQSQIPGSPAPAALRERWQQGVLRLEFLPFNPAR